MSTKIYYARRIPLSRLNELIDKIRPQAINMIAKKINILMDDIVVTDPIPKAFLNQKDSWIRDKQFESILKLCVENSKTINKDIWGIECGLNIWVRERYAYVIPCFPDYNLLNNLRWPKWAEDYSYWNNTDPPDGISQVVFNRRGKIWEQINCGSGVANHNARRLYHAFVDISNGIITGTWDIRCVLFPSKTR